MKCEGLAYDGGYKRNASLSFIAELKRRCSVLEVTERYN